MVLADVAATLKIKGVFITKNGQRYLRIVNFDFTPVIGDFKINITGISPDPEISELLIQIENTLSTLKHFFTDQQHLNLINQYWPLLYRDIIPQTKEIWEPHVISRINAYLLRVPINTLIFSADS